MTNSKLRHARAFAQKNRGAIGHRRARPGEAIPSSAPVQPSRKRRLPVEKLSTRNVYEFMEARSNAPVRANRETALLHNALRWAIRWGLIDRNVADGVMKFPETPRQRYVTTAELLDFLERASAPLKCAALLSVLTGLRQGDVLALMRSHVRQDAIVVTPSKTARRGGRTLEIELTDGLRAVLAECARLPGVSVYLVHRRDGQPYTRDGFKAMWQRAMRAYAARGGERFTFHDLRRKSGSDHPTGEHLGHLDRRTLERVYRVRPERVEPTDL